MTSGGCTVLTKKEALRKFNKLILDGRVYKGRTVTGQKLSELMEAYKVDYVGRFAKYGYTCVLCGEPVEEADFFISCRLRGTSHKWKDSHPVHAKCLKEV